MADIKFGIGFDVDKKGLEQIKKELSTVQQKVDMMTGRMNKGMKTKYSSDQLKSLTADIHIMDKALAKAFDKDLGKLNFKTFNRELEKSNRTLVDMVANFEKAGGSGLKIFESLQAESFKTANQLKKTKTVLDDMLETLGRTAKWNAASGVINKFQSTIQQAIGFTKSLDNSLNNIRIVTGKSTGEMKVFAQEANEAAKALGKTTTEYTDASLLFFQQGKSAAEVKELTEATIMAANITGTDVTSMADMITSALNGYSWSADKAIKVTDTLAAVGAATGADFNELAVGMSKVASQAATVGVPFEKLNAMLATISETTREAPETIGTSLKTVFARMSEIKLTGSATDEDGVTMSLGKVQDALSLIDVSLLDTKGAMKDMGGVIEEIGEKWSGLDVATKSAITNAMAGQRQASRLMALFNQWERYEVALEEAQNASGTTMEQNAVRMDSLEYKTKQLKATTEELYMKILNEDTIGTVVEGMTFATEKVSEFIDAFGGIKNIIVAVGVGMIALFNTQIAGGLDKLISRFKEGKSIAMDAAGTVGKLATKEGRQQLKEGGAPSVDEQRLAAHKEQIEKEKEAGRISDDVAKAKLSNLDKQIEITRQEEKYRKHLNQSELDALKAAKERLQVQQAQLEALKQERTMKKQQGEEAFEKAKESEFKGVKGAAKKREAYKEKGKTDPEGAEKDRLALLAKLQKKQDDVNAAEKEGLEYKDTGIKLTQEEVESANAIFEQSNKDMLLKRVRNAENLQGLNAQERAMKKVMDAAKEEIKGLKTEEEINQRIFDIIGEQMTAHDNINQAYAERQDLLEAIQNETEVEAAGTDEKIAERGAQEAADEIGSIFDSGKLKETIGKYSKLIGGIGATAFAAAPAIKIMFSETSTGAEKTEAGFQAAEVAATALGMAIGGPLGAAVGSVTVKLGKMLFESTSLTKKFEDSAEEIENTKNSINDLQVELNDLTRVQKMYNDIDAITAYGVTEEEKESYAALRNEVATLRPELVKYYDEYGNAVLSTRGELDKLVETQEELLRQEREKQALQAGAVGAQASYGIEEAQDKLSKEQERTEQLQEEIDKLRKYQDPSQRGDVSEKDIRKMMPGWQGFGDVEDKDIEEALASKQKQYQDAASAVTALNKQIAETAQSSGQDIVDSFLGASETVDKLSASTQTFIKSAFTAEDVEKIRNTTNATKEYQQAVANKDFEAIKNMQQKAFDEEFAYYEKMAVILKDMEEAGDPAIAQLGKASSATKEFISTQMRSLMETTDLTDEQLKTLYTNIAKYVDENMGVIDVKALMADKSITDMLDKETQDLIGKLQGVKDKLEEIKNSAVFSDESMEEFINRLAETSSKGLGSGLNDILNQNSNQMRVLPEESLTQVEDLKKEYEEVNTTLERRMDILRELNEFGVLDMAGMDSEKLGQTIDYAEEALKLEEYQESIQTLNQAQSDLTAANDAYVYSLADTTSGLETLNEAYGSLMGDIYDLGNADGMFEGIDAELEALYGKMEEGPEKFALMQEKSAEMAQAIGNNFASLPDKLGDKYDDVLKILGTTQEEMSGLASAAMKGNVEAAKKLEQQVGKMYASVMKHDETYYRNFVIDNKNQLKVIEEATGFKAENFKNLSEYKAKLEEWMTNNEGEAEKLRLENFADYLNDQQDGMFQNTTVLGKIGEQQVTVADAAASLIILDGMQKMIESAGNAGDAGISAGSNILSAMSGVTEGSKAIVDEAIAKMQAEAKNAQEALAIIQNAKQEIAAKLGVTVPKETWKPTFNFRPGGGSTPPPPPPPESTPPLDTGGPDKDSGGGGDKGGSEEKEVEDLEWEEDIYHDINIQLEQKQQLLDKLQKQQDKLYGKELLDNLAKQKKALQDQQKLLEKKLEMQKQDLKLQAQDLSKQGVKFNVDGTIANYNELLKQKLAYVNSLSGEAKEAAKEEFGALTEMMEKYEDLLMNGINEMENAIQDSIDAQREIFIQEFEYTIKMQIELSDDFQKALDFQKEMADSFEDYSENYERTMNQLGQSLGEVAAIQDHINKIQNDSSLTDKERIEMLSEYSEKLKEVVKDAKKLQEEMLKLVEGGLKEGLGLIKEHLDGYKAIDNQIKHIQAMTKLLGKEGDFEFLDDLYSAQYANVQGQLDVLLAQKKSLEAQRDTYEKGSEEWKLFNNELTKTEEQINKLSQDALKVLQDQFKNTINGIMNDLDKALSKGMGLKELRDEYKDLKEERKEYLDIEEKITETGKLQKKIQDAMKNTTDPKQLAALQKFRDKELAQLKEKDKLTKYDVDRANILYELTLKQIALDEQRNAKNMMKLVRDAQGNWVYEFVEDSEAVAKAQEDLSKELDKLQDLDKKQFEKTQEDMLKAKEDYVKKVQDIINKQMKGEYASDEEFKAALEGAQSSFNDRMQELGDRLNEAQVNGITSSLATILQAYLENDEALGLLTEEQEAMMEQLATAVGGDFTKLAELMAALNSGNLEDFNAMAEGMGLKGEDLRAALEGLTGQIREDWGGNISDMIGDITNLGLDTNSTVEDILNAWNEYKGKVEETTNKTGDSLQGLVDKLGEVSGATDSLNSKTDSLIGRFDAEMSQIAAVVAEYKKLENAYSDNIKKATDYIAKLDELIRKQKEQASGVGTPTAPTPPPGGSGSGSGGKPPAPAPPPKPPAPPAPKPPKKNGQVKVKTSNANAWYDSSNNRPVPDWNSQARAAGVAWDAPMWSVNANNGKMALSKTNNINGALAWVKETDLVGLRTGGYTGAFNNPQEGKLAMLHEKELVLNKEDTSNMLKAVKEVRGNGDLGQIVKTSILQATDRIVSAISRLGSGMVVNGNSIDIGSRQDSQEIQQSVSINADFSGVRDSKQIEKAFDSLAIQASQYAMKKR